MLCRFINESRWDIGQLNLYSGSKTPFPVAIAACNNNTEVTFSNVYNGGVPVAGKSTVDVTSFLSGVEAMYSLGSGLLPLPPPAIICRAISRNSHRGLC